jgi:putative ABC transport system substrate-binding protein
MLNFSIVLCLISFSSLADEIKIGVAWKGKSSMADRVYESFLLGLGDSRSKFNFELKKNLKSIDKLDKTVKEFEKNKKGILLFRSNAYKYLSKSPTRIPSFVGAGNNPLALGITNDLKKPNKNATGVTYYIPLSRHYKIFKSIFPNMKKILLITESGHPGSSIEIKETKEQCQKYNLICSFIQVSSDKDLLTKLSKESSRFDFIALGAEDLVMRNTSKLVKLFSSTPVVAYASRPVKDGALIGFVASDKVLGHKLASSFKDYFLRGVKLSEIPFKVDENPEFQINEKTARSLKIRIPFEVLNAAKMIK